MSSQNNITHSTSTSLTKGMIKDYNESYNPKGSWNHARNAVDNSHDGQLGVLGNEPSTLLCKSLRYKMIGSISLTDERAVIFSTDETNHEIGVFDSKDCSYTELMSSYLGHDVSCLNFSIKHLITGTSRKTFDCSERVYWADGNNPDRMLDINNIPWVQDCTIVSGCKTCTDTTIIDCERLRLAPLLTIPCLNLVKAKGSGVLPNGTYQVAVAYSINEIRVTDYLIVSNTVSLFSHNNNGGSLELTISDTDSDFDEIEIVVISNVNSQITAKRLGLYSTRQGVINIDALQPSLESVKISDIPLSTPSYEKSDAIYNVGDFLIKTGIYTTPDFNYQPLANQIHSNWNVIVKPGDYYKKGGELVGYLRGEVYAFFIRFVYNTGDKSASYHIPGRTSGVDDEGNVGGTMAFWESTEKYPDNNISIWGNLCGQNIRHHKFPTNSIGGGLNHFNSDGTINILGIRFTNIQHPEDINGNYIEGIVGYEILRGSREGNKSIIAKGMINNIMGAPSSDSHNTILYQNYPYNDRHADVFYKDDIPTVTENYLSFHSPETTFQHPYIGASAILETYGVLAGSSTGSFEKVHNHPEFKLLSDFSNDLTELLGLLSALSILTNGTSFSASNDLPYSMNIGPLQPFPQKDKSWEIVGSSITGGTIPTPTSDALYTINVATWLADTAVTLLMVPYTARINKQKIFEIITSLIPHVQYAAQGNSHGYYDRFINQTSSVNTIDDYGYIKNNVQTFDGKPVNNLYRNPYVILKTNNWDNLISYPENSRSPGHPGDSIINYLYSGYGAIKITNDAQYGQLENIKQIPITNCVDGILPGQYVSTELIFNGDTYINRYTEKNQFTFFNDWLYGQPNDFHYDYRNYFNLPNAKYWVDNRKIFAHFWTLSADYASLFDRQMNTFDFYIHSGWFYISMNGVRDFFVESEVNLGYRDWEDEISKQYYDPYGFSDLSLMFRSDVIKSAAYYKYDYSLSTSKFYNQYISWGSILSRDFNPSLAESCYSYFPRRVLYSLPQSQELKKDNWQSFLVNNYKDFPSKLTSIKNMNKTGAVILFEKDGPVIFNGVDTLQTSNDIKVTIGDGGLFNNVSQSITNADKSFQYGAAQNKYGVIATPVGVFYIGAQHGKIFKVTGDGIEDITIGMKWWFSRYLPFKLLEYFPNCEYKDNTMAGIGVTMSFDNVNEILYISKKDYIPKTKCIVFTPGVGFQIDTGCISTQNPIGLPTSGTPNQKYVSVNITDADLFKEISWTMSYNVKNKEWVSFHDWHPNWVIQTHNHFITGYQKPDLTYTELWKHNERVDSFCNFYGTDYPFEIEFISDTGKGVTTIKNLEYLLECYKYSTNKQDKYHVPDFNFDQAIISNSEQVSGLLLLNLKSKTNPYQDLSYPQITPNGIKILYSKEEQKYRFSQFWDITKDRGEFSGASNVLINYSDDGYTRIINPSAVDYYKTPPQRKKFRHTNDRIFLRRSVCGDKKMNVKIIDVKIQESNR